jgi:outer membrane protein assembly factor BamB
MESRRRNSAYARLTGRMGERIETGVLAPLSERMQRRAFRARALAAAGALGLVAGAVWVWTAQANRPQHQALGVPGSHVWASEARDAQGTHTVDYAGPVSPTARLVLRDPSGFAGGPAVGVNGIVYAASLSGTLYAAGVSGQTAWTARVPAQPVGGPAIGPGGDLYVADIAGGLSAFDPRGAARWRYAPDDGAKAIAGPIVSADGTVVYATEGYLLAVEPGGRLKWRAQAPYSFFNPSPRLSSDGDVAFFKDVAYDARTGAILIKESVDPLDHFIVAANGRAYLLSENALLEWRSTEQGIALAQVAPMDYARQFPGTPIDGGVMTARRQMWLFFSNEYQDARALWMELSGRVTGAIGIRYRLARVAGVDRDSILYTCGTVSSTRVECAAYAPNTDEPLWAVGLASQSTARGAALAPGRLYVATGEGGLYALEDSPP